MPKFFLPLFIFSFWASLGGAEPIEPQASLAWQLHRTTIPLTDTVPPFFSNSQAFTPGKLVQLQPQETVWLQTILPRTVWKDPGIYFRGHWELTLLEIYIGKQRIFRCVYEKCEGGGDLKRVFIIELPEKYIGQSMTFRLEASGGGSFNAPLIQGGNRADHFVEAVRYDFNRLSIGVFLLLIGIFQMIIWIRSRTHPATLAFGCFALTAGMLDIRTCDFMLVLFPADTFWNYVELLGYPLMLASLFAFIEQIFGTGPYFITRRIWQIILVYFGVSLILVVLDLVEVPTLGIFFSIASQAFLVLIFPIFWQIWKKGHPAKRPFAIGILVMMAVGVNDTLIVLGRIEWVQWMLHWGALVFVLVLGFILERHFADIRSRLQRINEATSRFVPHQLLTQLGRNSITEVQLGDQLQKTMTVLFSDIRSFTTLSESMTPAENFRFINNYLSQMGPIVRQHHGFIDKYIGDAIMALFDSPENALNASIAMLHQKDVWNQQRLKNREAPIQIGIGLNTGNVMLGTVGESNRMEGTVISDAVNLASRIEGMTKVYGTPLIISENTYQGLATPVEHAVRFIDRVTVKGKSRPVVVYEVFDADSLELRQKKESIALEFEKGWHAFQHLEYVEALRHFKACLQLHPEDLATQVYLERCHAAVKGDFTG